MSSNNISSAQQLQNNPQHLQQQVAALQQQQLTPPILGPMIGQISADQLQQVNMLWAQMISVLTQKPQQPQLSNSQQQQQYQIQQAHQQAQQQAAAQAHAQAQAMAQAQAHAQAQQQVHLQQLQQQISNSLIQSNQGLFNQQPQTLSENFGTNQSGQNVLNPEASGTSSKQKISQSSRKQQKPGEKAKSVSQDKLKHLGQNRKIAQSTFKSDKKQEALATCNTDVSTAVSANHQATPKKSGSQKNEAKLSQTGKNINLSPVIKKKPGRKPGSGTCSPKPVKKHNNFRGKNSYLCFKDEYFKGLLQIQGTEKKTHQEVMVLIGQKWKALPEEEKKKYQDLAKIDQKRVEDKKQAQAQQELKTESIDQKKNADTKKSVASPAPKAKGTAFVKKGESGSAAENKPKFPFFFYMQIRKSELKQERLLQEQSHPEATDQKLPTTNQEISAHVNAEWKMLTDEQKGRFNIPNDIQKQLRLRKQMDDVEVLRQLVLTQKLPPEDAENQKTNQFGEGKGDDKIQLKS